VFLRVDFQFVLIEWVLGTELLAKVANEVSRLSPKSQLDSWNVSGDRSLGELSFSRGLCSSRLSRQNKRDRFSPMGCSEDFLSKRVSVMLWTWQEKLVEAYE
jgi:hypothetical protein